MSNQELGFWAAMVCFLFGLWLGQQWQEARRASERIIVQATCAMLARDMRRLQR